MAEKKSGKGGFLVLGIVIGIVAWWILGFTAFGWVTGGTAEDRVNEAVLPLAAEICVNNFKADPDFAKHLAALKELDSWQRDNYIEEKGKWAVMAGDDIPRNGVAGQCVGKLDSLLK